MACCTPLSYLLARMWSAGAAHPAMLGRKVVSCSQPDWQRPRRSEEAKSEKALHLSLTTAMPPPPPPANGYWVCPAFECDYLQICLAYLLKIILFCLCCLIPA